MVFKVLTYTHKNNFKLVNMDRSAFISLLPGFLFYTTSEAATEAAWRLFLAPVSSKASFSLSTVAGGSLTPASDERRHVGVHLLQDLHVERHA